MKITKLLLLLSLVLASYMTTGCTGCAEDALDPANNIQNSSTNDLDDDGIVDSEDDDIDGDGIANDKDDDLDGDGTTNEDDNDLDGDGIANHEDDDVDGDGIDNGSDNDDDGDGINDNEDDSPIGNTTPSIMVRVDDTVTYNVEVPADGTADIEKTETLNTEDIRNDLIDAGVNVDDFDIVGIKVYAKDKSSDFIDRNATKEFVLKFYVDGELAISTPEAGDSFDVLKMSELKSELTLNNGLYITNPGFEEFLNVIKDNSKSTSDIKMTITPIDEFDTKTGDEIAVTFIVQTSTKKNL